MPHHLKSETPWFPWSEIDLSSNWHNHGRMTSKECCDFVFRECCMPRGRLTGVIKPWNISVIVSIVTRWSRSLGDGDWQGVREYRTQPQHHTSPPSHDALTALQLMRQDGISVHTSAVLPKMISKHLVLSPKTLAPSRCLFPEAWSPKALRRLELGVRLTGQTGRRARYYLIVRYAMFCTSALCLLKLFST